MSIEQRLKARLEERDSNKLTRKRVVLTSPQQTRITLSGRKDEILNFCSNDYLGLANHVDAHVFGDVGRRWFGWIFTASGSDEEQ